MYTVEFLAKVEHRVIVVPE